VARKKKPSGRASHGPFSFADMERAIKKDGWEEAGHGDHPNYEHDTKPGKVQLDKKWTGVKKGSLVFRSVARQAGLTTKQFLDLLNG
jgi:predicted RNA binding protein YcfA (HicA-like mRNA interferase family)